MKGQPLAYNKDNQEDKEPLFDAADTLRDVFALLAELLAGVEPQPERMRAALREGFATATDLADYLVRKGMPFRDAHEAVARAVKAAEKAGKDLSELTAAELKAVSPLIGEDVRSLLTPEGSVASRGLIGGTAPDAVRAAIARGRERLAGRSESSEGTDSELP
jgi:argininosuccinate lyase